MPRKEHDRPDPNLIIHGSRRVQPSKRGLGIDYPITPLEELNERQQSKLTILSSIIMHLPFQANDDVVMQDIQNDASNDAFFKVYSEVMQGEGRDWFGSGPGANLSTRPNPGWQPGPECIGSGLSFGSGSQRVNKREVHFKNLFYQSNREKKMYIN